MDAEGDDELVLVKSEELRKLKRYIKQLEGCLTTAMKEFDTVSEEIENKMAAVKKELNHYKDQNNELENKLVASQKLNAGKDEEIKHLKETNEALFTSHEKQRQDFDNDRQTLLAEKMQLEGKMTDLKGQLEAIKTQTIFMPTTSTTESKTEVMNVDDVFTILLAIGQFEDFFKDLHVRDEQVSLLNMILTFCYQQFEEALHKIRDEIRITIGVNTRRLASAAEIMANILYTSTVREYVSNWESMPQMLVMIKALIENGHNTGTFPEAEELLLMTLYNLSLLKSGCDLLSQLENLIPLLASILKSKTENVLPRVITVKLLRSMVIADDDCFIFCNLQQHLPYDQLSQIGLSNEPEELKAEVSKLMRTLENFCAINEC